MRKILLCASRPASAWRRLAALGMALLWCSLPACTPSPTTYRPKAGETLDSIAAAHGLSPDELLAANPTLTASGPVRVGEAIVIPSPTVRGYSGTQPARGTTAPAPRPIFPPVTSTLMARSPALYDRVINQLAVEINPRYRRSGAATYCNIFVWDVTQAMNCPVPHWVLPGGAIADPRQLAGAQELDADEVSAWLTAHGAANGWQLATAQLAQRHANKGKPAIAIWSNQRGHGHMAIVRAGVITADGPAIAQAGEHNFTYGHLTYGFRMKQPLFYTHQ